MNNWLLPALMAASKLRVRQTRQSKTRRSGRFTRHLGMETLEVRQMLSITVNTLSDEDDGINVGGISLRDAINAAAPSGDTIDFDLNVPELNGGTITLEHGEIPFSKPITIDAHLLTSGITIDAGNGTDHIAGTGDGSRIFNITDPTFGSSPPLVTIIGLTLTGGDVSGTGGAINSAGILTLRDSIVTGNHGISVEVSIRTCVEPLTSPVTC